MNSYFNVQKLSQKLKENDTAFGVMLHIITGICAFLFAHAAIMDKMIPFGVSLVGSVKRKYLASAVAGGILGYISVFKSGSLSYLAAIFAIICIKFILGNSKLTKSPVFFSILCFVVVGTIKFAVGISFSEPFANILSEAALSGVAAYFIAITYNIVPSSSSGLDVKELSSLVFFVSLIVLSLTDITLLNLSLGRILSVTIILIVARYGEASYGAVCGSIIAFINAISNGEYLNLSIIFAFSGLMCGLFSGLGSLGMVASYISVTLISSFVSGEVENSLIMFFEAVIGCGLFLIFPQKLGGRLCGLLSPPTEISRLDSIKGSLIMRLEFASGALKDIYETVEDVAKKLGEINSPNFEKTLNKIELEVCGGCSLRKHCWETAREITAADALNRWNKNGGDKPEKNGFNCLRSEFFDASVNTHISEYENKKAAEIRLSEVRGVINDQFEGISQMLNDLSEEFKYEVRHDAVAAEDITLSLKNLGFHTINCIAAIDKFDRLSADIHIKGAADHTINKMEIMRNLSMALGKRLDTPSISIGGDEAFIFITEKPKYQIEIGVSQIPETSEKLCGDSLKYFRDGRGRLMMVLSDGMGTGGRAAVDSAMVSGLMSRMLRSGFGYDCSLKIINSSMLFKSTDESLATVDITTIDLFNGNCELLKAGAAPTFVRRRGKIGKAQSNSLPPGILRNVAFDKAKINLKSDDIVVMVSDGVTFDDDDWICNIIKNWTIGSAQQLADEIALGARRRRNDGHNDDISVMVAIIK